jgi:hypothetical protein
LPQDTWLAKVYEVLVKYRPDLIYFDFGFGKVIASEYEQKLFATAYDWATVNDREIAVTQKDAGIAAHTGILDFERGREACGTPFPWLTDTALSSCFYVASAGFRSTQTTVGILIRTLRFAGPITGNQAGRLCLRLEDHVAGFANSTTTVVRGVVSGKTFRCRFVS